MTRCRGKFPFFSLVEFAPTPPHTHQDQPLPLLWTADFILGAPKPPWVDGKDYYFIGELNCACVGITTQLYLTPVVASQVCVCVCVYVCVCVCV
jgi:hypothetical protein